MSLNYRCRCFLFFFLLIQLMFGWIKVIPLLNTEQYAKQYNKVCLEKNTWIKNFRESKRFTLHILNTLIFPDIILKIVAFHDFLLKAFWASQPANGWSNHGMRQFSKSICNVRKKYHSYNYHSVYSTKLLQQSKRITGNFTKSYEISRREAQRFYYENWKMMKIHLKNHSINRNPFSVLMREHYIENMERIMMNSGLSS